MNLKPKQKRANIMNNALTPAIATFNATIIESDVAMPISDQTNLIEVQNGTEIMSPKLSKYIEQYNSFARKTAESIIQLARTLVQAENDLDPIDFEIFAKAVNVDKNGATIKKLRVIGKNASRFDAHIGMLPQAWTTIYRLANIKADQFEQLASNNVITPFMTASDINNNITSNSRSKAKSKTESFDVNISMSNLDVSAKSQIYAMLYAMQNKFNFNLHVDSSIKDQIIDYRQNVAV